MCRALLYLGQPVLLDNLLYQPDSALTWHDGQVVLLRPEAIAISDSDKR